MFATLIPVHDAHRMYRSEEQPAEVSSHMGTKKTRNPLSIADVIILSICIHLAVIYGLSKIIPTDGQRALSDEEQDQALPVPVAVLKPNAPLRSTDR